MHSQEEHIALRPLEGSEGYVSTISIHRNDRPYLNFYEWTEGKQNDKNQSDCKQIC